MVWPRSPEKSSGVSYGKRNTGTDYEQYRSFSGFSKRNSRRYNCITSWHRRLRNVNIFLTLYRFQGAATGSESNQVSTVLMDLLTAYENGQEDSEPAGSPILVSESGATVPKSTDDNAGQPESHVQPTPPDLELGQPEYASDKEERRLRRQVRKLQGHLHMLQDELAQADADLAREKRHSDLKIGIALQKVDKKIIGFSRGQILYEKKLTAEERHFERYGTYEPIGPGPFALGSWIDWGNKDNRPLTHEEVAQWRSKVKAKAAAAMKADALRMLSRPLAPAEAGRFFCARFPAVRPP